MSTTYADGGSFRQALEARLRRTAEERGIPLNTLRQKVVMERLLARLFADDEAGWRLKGGYAMELRLANRARTTRDLDLAALPTPSTASGTHDTLLEALRNAAALDLGDFVDFAVEAGRPLADDGPGGFRFFVTARMGGRQYASFHVDVGLDASATERPELVHCDDHLAFAGIPPARVQMVPRERQFAEKIHAYTRPWGDRTNTRTKDLIDLLLLIELGLDDAGALRTALRGVFGRRGSHVFPGVLPEPPAEWVSDYGQLAEQTGLHQTSLAG